MYWTEPWYNERPLRRQHFPKLSQPLDFSLYRGSTVQRGWLLHIRTLQEFFILWLKKRLNRGLCYKGVSYIGISRWILCSMLIRTDHWASRKLPCVAGGFHERVLCIGSWAAKQRGKIPNFSRRNKHWCAKSRQLRRLQGKIHINFRLRRFKVLYLGPFSRCSYYWGSTVCNSPNQLR